MPELHRLYLDQMFGRSVAAALHGAGHDVIRAEEYGQARADDQEILQKAIADNRILVTLDEHFGDWVVLPLRQHPGVIRIKVHPSITEKILQILLPFLQQYNPASFRNHLVVLSAKRSKWIDTDFDTPRHGQKKSK